MSQKYLLLILITLVLSINGAKILGIFHFHSKSHHILGSALLKALAKRGHEVTMLSPYPLKTPLKNYEDIELTGMLDDKFNIVQRLTTMKHSYNFQRTALIHDYTYQINEFVLNHDAVKHLLSSGRKFDLVIQNWFFNTAFLGIGHHFNAPTILFGTFGTSIELNKFTMNPTPYSYVPDVMADYGSEMTYWERLENTAINILIDLRDHFFVFPKQEELLAKYFPEAPPLSELLYNVSLVLLNSHFSIESPRPYMPMMIPIGGFHVEDSSQMDDDLKTFLDESQEGVIYFSFGTNLKPEMLPPEKVSAIIKCFAKLPVKVLWKFHIKDQSIIPPNVKISRWFPQLAILAHPNTKLFITHGGLLSTTETVYYGVPMLGIPFFADQHKNVGFGVNNGYGLRLLSEYLTEDSLCEKINELLTNPRYKENIKRRSLALRDQPLKPMDNAIFWVEYALRHKEAPLLKSVAMKMPWYQYYLVDVIALFVGVSVAILILMYLVVRLSITMMRSFFGKSSVSVSPKKKSKKA